MALLALFFGAGVFLHEPAEPNFTTIEEGCLVGDTRENPLNFSEGDLPLPKPVRLYIDVEVADLDILPNAASGMVEIGGSYDEANFHMDHEVNEHEDYTDYRIRFRPKNAFSGVWNPIDDHGQPNKIRIKLPNNLVLALDLRSKLGTVDVHLGGLAISDMDVNHSLGIFELHMSEPNKVAMERMRLEVSMSEAGIFDLQNLGFRHGRFEGSMGELLLCNSGDFTSDMDLDLEMTMGDTRLEVPDNVLVEASTRVMLGESRAPRSKNKQDKNFVLRVNGGVTIGEHRVIYRTRGQKGKKKGLHSHSDSQADFQDTMWKSFLRENHTESAIEDYRRKNLTDPEQNFLSKKQLIKVGKKLLQAERYDDAILTFHFIAELHPDYPTAYEYLAEAFEYSDQEEEALRWYRKTLELDPDNRFAQKKVRRLEAQN